MPASKKKRNLAKRRARRLERRSKKGQNEKRY
jgi:hypothetical protein